MHEAASVGTPLRSFLRPMKMLCIPIVSGTILFFAATGVVQPAGAGVIYDNGVPAGDGSTNGLFSNDPSPTNGFQIADDFELQPGAAVINDVHWYGGYGNNTLSPFSPPFAADNFLIRIFADDGGVPSNGTPLHEVAVGNTAQRTNLGSHDFVFGAGDLFQYSVEIDAIALDASTIYWLSIVNQEMGPEDLWMWATSGAGNAARRNPLTPSDWEAGTHSMAFSLTFMPAVIPIPPALLLFVSGLAAILAIGFLGRRHREAEA